MKRFWLLIVIVCYAFISMAQKTSTIECWVEADKITEVNFYKVVDGRPVKIVNAKLDKDNYFGYKFSLEYEGFYVLETGHRVYFPMYLKSGDNFSIEIKEDEGKLVGKNTPENKKLYEWVDMTHDLEFKAVHFDRAMSTYKDFFPQFEEFFPKAEPFKASIKTKNARFNKMMADYVDYSLDYYAISLVSTPRSEHPKNEEMINHYSTIILPEKYTDNSLLALPFGNRHIVMVSMLLMAQHGKNLDEIVELIPDNQLKGEVILDAASRMRSYFEYEDCMKKYGNIFNDRQKLAMEAFGSKLYEVKKGAVAADFTYPDVDGNMVSLSDFKGKVVLVDVWATWCGPCLAEVPSLKKLEEEMHGTDVVFLAVSVDEQKDHEKWKKMIVEKELKGIHLFANGWSKITKDYDITGIPRFMVFDREGKIVESNAPRPSNPALKKLLESLL